MEHRDKIPCHVAIIMDGNGRWAKKHGKDRCEGHIKGVDGVDEAIRSSLDYGVKYLTLYAFSTENWGRPQAEVDALMDLFCKSVVSRTPDLKQKKVRVKIIGDRSRFSVRVLEHLEFIERETSTGEALTLLLALNYSSREEIARATKLIAQRVAQGELQAEEITPEVVSQHLYTGGIPDPDLVIRTSGESRLSNFLMWQSSYAELYFPDVLWPDFDKAEFGKALEVYASRDRRFGLVK